MSDQHTNWIPGQRRGGEYAQRQRYDDPRAEPTEPLSEVVGQNVAPQPRGETGFADRRVYREADGHRKYRHHPAEEDHPRAIGIRLQPPENAQCMNEWDE